MAGRAGQQPRNAALKVLTGTTGVKIKDRSRAHLASGGVPVVGPGEVGYIPPPPDKLKMGLPGRRYWRVYWKHGGEWLTMVDFPLVERLCFLHDVAHRLWEAIEKEGLTRQSDMFGLVANGVLNDYHKTISQIEKLESALGLNPIERSKIRVQVKNKESTLDAWRRNRSATSPVSG